MTWCCLALMSSKEWKGNRKYSCSPVFLALCSELKGCHLLRLPNDPGQWRIRVKNGDLGTGHLVSQCHLYHIPAVKYLDCDSCSSCNLSSLPAKWGWQWCLLLRVVVKIKWDKMRRALRLVAETNIEPDSLVTLLLLVTTTWGREYC